MGCCVRCGPAPGSSPHQQALQGTVLPLSSPTAHPLAFHCSPHGEQVGTKPSPCIRENKKRKKQTNQTKQPVRVGLNPSVVLAVEASRLNFSWTALPRVRVLPAWPQSHITFLLVTLCQEWLLLSLPSSNMPTHPLRFSLNNAVVSYKLVKCWRGPSTGQQR